MRIPAIVAGHFNAAVQAWRTAGNEAGMPAVIRQRAVDANVLRRDARRWLPEAARPSWTI